MYFTHEVEHKYMKTMKLVKKTLAEKWKWIFWVGKGKSHSWKGVKEREKEGSISPEKWTCQRESGGGRGNGRARNGSEQKTHFVFWHLAAFSFFQSSVNAQSKVLCDGGSSHRHKHSSCLEGYSLWLRILTVFLAMKTIEGFGHKSSYWWGQPSFFVYVCWYTVHVCVFVCMLLCACGCLCVWLCVQTVTLEGSRGTRQEQLVLHWGWLGTPGRATSSRSSKFAQKSS